MEDPRVEARNALSQPRRPSSRAHPRLFQLRRGVKAPEPTSPVRTLSPPSLALLCPWNCFPGRRREASTTRGPSSLGGTNSPAQLKCTPQRSPARRPASIVSLSRPRGGRRRCLPSPSPPPRPPPPAERAQTPALLACGETGTGLDTGSHPTLFSQPLFPPALCAPTSPSLRSFAPSLPVPGVHLPAGLQGSRGPGPGGQVKGRTPHQIRISNKQPIFFFFGTNMAHIVFAKPRAGEAASGEPQGPQPLCPSQPGTW